MLKSLFRKKKKKYIVAVLDIGSTKIVCLIAYVKPNGKINVIGIGHSESSGFKSGLITDKKLAETSIITAVDIAEKMAGEEVDHVIVTISSNSMQSNTIRSQLNLNGNIINERDISNLITHSLRNIDSTKNEIIHYSPLCYYLDDVKDVKNPIGLFGYKLRLDLHAIILPNSLVYNLINCLADCHLDIEDIIVSPFASSFSCLSEDEKELGVTLIDLGGATTSYSVFHEKKLLSVGSVPYGASIITSDIAKILSISTKNAERIKILNGSALVTFADNYKMIDLPIIGDQNQDLLKNNISNADLNSIITARAEEIFEMIINKIKQSNIDPSCLGRIVLTGGGTLLIGIKELATNIFKTKVRIAKPSQIEGMPLDEDQTSFAAAIGALQYLAEKSYKNYLNTKIQTQQNKSNNLYKQTISKILKYIRKL